MHPAARVVSQPLLMQLMQLGHYGKWLESGEVSMVCNGAEDINRHTGSSGWPQQGTTLQTRQGPEAAGTTTLQVQPGLCGCMAILPGIGTTSAPGNVV